jgi:intracellular sulfur oxidation DsrE/DsrF family protein
MLKVIIHAPTPPALIRARRNLANLIAAEPSTVVELVINGEAVQAELKDPDQTTRPYLAICQNSLDHAGVDKPEDARTVPSAVLYISQRQAEGWVYFRA